MSPPSLERRRKWCVLWAPEIPAGTRKMKQRRAITGFEYFKLLWQPRAVVHFICGKSCSNRALYSSGPREQTLRSAYLAASHRILLPLQNFPPPTPPPPPKQFQRNGLYFAESDLETCTAVFRGRMKAWCDSRRCSQGVFPGLSSPPGKGTSEGCRLEGWPVPRCPGSRQLRPPQAQGCSARGRGTRRGWQPLLWGQPSPHAAGLSSQEVFLPQLGGCLGLSWERVHFLFRSCCVLDVVWE